MAAGGFEDDDGGVHEPALDALAAEGVLAGTECGEGLICPAEPFQRWVMAVWMVRALDESLSPVPTRFADVDPDVWWAPYVEQLAELRITLGCSTHPARFCPNDSVTRGQMATFLARALELVPLPEPTGTVPAESRFTAVEISSTRLCALRADGTVACHRLTSQGGPFDTPGGQFTAIAVGRDHSCGIRTDGTLDCWGANVSGQSNSPGGRFTAITVGRDHSCGIPADKTIACWGSNQDGRTEPPEGQFTAVTSGDGLSCGIRADKTIACWGSTSHGHAEPPEGQFTAIATDTNHLCGIRIDETIDCWGDPDYGHTPQLDGRFTTLATSNRHLCGLRTDGTVTCWGDNEWRQTDTPEGQFTAIAAGEGYSCGIRSDGAIDCWGDPLVLPPVRAHGADPYGLLPSKANKTTTRQLAYVTVSLNDTAVFVTNTDGTDDRQITPNDLQSRNPVWSPDGTRIAYTSYGNIHLINTDGTNEEKLTRGQDPAWSPDGTRVAYTSTSWQIHLMNPDGTDQKQLGPVHFKLH